MPAQEVDDKGRCTFHPGIQLRHHKRSGEWRVLLNACPLCVSGLPPTAPRPDDGGPKAAAKADPEPEEVGGGVSRDGERPKDADRSPKGKSGRKPSSSSSTAKSSSSGRSSRDAPSGEPSDPKSSERRRRKSGRKEKDKDKEKDRERRGGGRGNRGGKDGGNKDGGSRGNKDGKRSEARSKSRGREEKPPRTNNDEKSPRPNNVDDSGGAGEADVPQQHPLQRKGSGRTRPRSPSPEQSPRVEMKEPYDGDAIGLPSPPIRHRTREDEAREYNSFVDFLQKDRQKMASAGGPSPPRQQALPQPPPFQRQREQEDEDGGDHEENYDGEDYDEEEEDLRTQDTVSDDESDRAEEEEDAADLGADGSNTDRTVDQDEPYQDEPSDIDADAGASFHSRGTRPADNLSHRRQRDPPPPPPQFQRQQRQPPPPPPQPQHQHQPSGYRGEYNYNPDGYGPQDYGRDEDEEHRGEHEDEVPSLASTSGNGSSGKSNNNKTRVLEQDEVSVMSMSSVTKNIRRDAAEAKLKRHQEEEDENDDDSSSSSSDSSSSSSDKRSRRKGSKGGSRRKDDVRSAASSRNTRKSAERAIVTFDPDARGFCKRHPTVRLKKKTLTRRWKVKLSNCPECCLDEMRRLKESRLRAKRDGGGSSRRSGRKGGSSGRGESRRGRKQDPPISQLKYRAKGDDDRSVGTASTITTFSSHTAPSGSVRSASPQRQVGQGQRPANVTRMPYTDKTGRGGWYTGQVDPDTGSPSGSGTMNYSDGGIYDGEWDDGAPVGQRRLPDPRRGAGQQQQGARTPQHHRSPQQHHRHRGPGGVGSPQGYGYRTPTSRSYLETLDEDAPEAPPSTSAGPPGRMPLGRPSGPIPGIPTRSPRGEREPPEDGPEERRVVCGIAWVDRHGDTGIYTGEVDARGVPEGVGSMRYDGGVVAEGVWSGGFVDGVDPGEGGCPSGSMSYQSGTWGGRSFDDAASVGHASYAGRTSPFPSPGAGGLGSLDRLDRLPGNKSRSGRRGGSASVH